MSSFLVNKIVQLQQKAEQLAWRISDHRGTANATVHNLQMNPHRRLPTNVPSVTFLVGPMEALDNLLSVPTPSTQRKPYHAESHGNLVTSCSGRVCTRCLVGVRASALPASWVKTPVNLKPSMMIWSMPVQCKGVEVQAATKETVESLNRFGYWELIVRSDTEPATFAFRDAVIRALKDVLVSVLSYKLHLNTIQCPLAWWTLVIATRELHSHGP